MDITKDTNRHLEEGEGVYYNEATGDFYHSKLRLLIDLYRSGWTRQEIEEALDLESDTGCIFWTTYE